MLLQKLHAFASLDINMIYSDQIMQKNNLITKFKEGLTREFSIGIKFSGTGLLEFFSIFMEIFFQVSLKRMCVKIKESEVDQYLFLLCFNHQKLVRKERLSTATAVSIF